MGRGRGHMKLLLFFIRLKPSTSGLCMLASQIIPLYRVLYRISDTNKPFMLSVIMLNVLMLNVVMLNVVMLNVIMLNVVMLNVIMLNVIILDQILLIVILLNVIMSISFC